MVGVYDFLRDSLPQMRQRRFGDLDYDFDFRVNTTAGTVGWHDRLLGIFHSPYQATDPDLFREMMASLPSVGALAKPANRLGSSAMNCFEQRPCIEDRDAAPASITAVSITSM